MKCMCNQMVTSEKGSGNYKDLDKTRLKLFPNFTSVPFYYLLISWVTNYVSNLGFLTCLSWIALELKFFCQVQNFSTKYLLESLFMCSFVCSSFLKRLFIPWHLQSFMTFFLTLRRTEGCHCNYVLSNVKLQIIAEISRQN